MKAALGALGAGFLSVVLVLVLMGGGIAAQGSADTAATVVVLEDLAAQSCVGTVNGAPSSVLVAGDSITVASEPALTAIERSTPLSFDATAGWTLTDGAASVETAVKDSPPGLLVMAFGTNDWADGATPTGVAAYEHEVTGVLAAIPATQPVVWVLPYAADITAPETSAAPGIVADLQALNTATATTLAVHSNVRVVNMDSAFGTNRALIGPDGLHPATPDGTAEWASTVGAAIGAGLTVTSSAPPPTNSDPAATVSLSQTQSQNAAAVIAVADSAGTGSAGAVIAVMVALTESSLETTAVNGDHIGLFQQSPTWGTDAQRLDPTDSAALFITRLETVAGWQHLQPWVAAQDVQASQFDGHPSSSNGYSSVTGGNYQAKYPEAEQIVGTTNANATDAGCGQQQGALPAAPDGKGGLPTNYQIPPNTDPAATKAITFALSKVGGPYVWGGNGPTGYDCSGLVTAAWAYAGVTIPRTSQAELGAGTPVTSQNISPGDLVLVPGSGDGGTLASPGHVAMYIGDGLVVAAADTAEGIIVQTYQDLTAGGLSGIRHIR